MNIIHWLFQNPSPPILFLRSPLSSYKYYLITFNVILIILQALLIIIIILLSDNCDLVDRQLYSVGPMSHFGEYTAVNRVMVETTLNVTQSRLLAVRMKYIFLQICKTTK